MANSKNIFVTGTGNFVGTGCDKIALVNCIDCNVEPGVSGLVAINCSGEFFYQKDSYKTFVNGSIYNGGGSTYANSGSAPIFVRGAYDIYFIDTSSGNVNILLDVYFLVDRRITFKIVDATNSVIFNAYNGTGSELFEFNAMPYTFTPALGDSLTVHFNGTDFYII